MSHIGISGFGLLGGFGLVSLIGFSGLTGPNGLVSLDSLVAVIIAAVEFLVAMATQAAAAHTELPSSLQALPNYQCGIWYYCVALLVLLSAAAKTHGVAIKLAGATKITNVAIWYYCAALLVLLSLTLEGEWVVVWVESIFFSCWTQLSLWKCITKCKTIIFYGSVKISLMDISMVVSYYLSSWREFTV
jgi:hypothetical protein